MCMHPEAMQITLLYNFNVMLQIQNFNETITSTFRSFHTESDAHTGN